MSDKTQATVTFIVLFIVLVLFTGWVLRTIVLRTSQVPTATLPPNDEVPTISPTPLIDIQSLSLLGSASYSPSPNIYSDSSVYDKESIRLALNGKFETAKIVVDGNVIGDGPHMISVNFSTESGVLNGVRNSANSIDLKQTEGRGGVFTKDHAIKFVVNLLGNTSLATSNKEFSVTKQLTKDIKFWDFLKQPPPTVARVLIAPFNESGVYGGATITKIDFQYTCANGSYCGAGVCDYGELESKCIKRNFGDSAEAFYKKSVGL
ncbi:MAG: hypothetical protein HYT67_00835 [Candidatus Yanofskybacteria bacterium]|nr:hypothetical protein [Candidatus Yanofskybacteria bacterium]